jgi:prevent-host-death family protein
MRRRILKLRETVSLYEAKTNLSALVERVAKGEEIVIAKSGTPKARLVPLEDTRPLRLAGRGKGKWKLDPSFDEPLPHEVVDEFSGGPP